MKRKDGRELVTVHPVTAMDMIDFVQPSEELLMRATACSRRRTVDSSWMEDEVEPAAGDFDEWGA